MGLLSSIVKTAIPAIAGSVGGPIAGAVASGLVSNAAGGGGGAVSRATTQPAVIPGTSFQPFTYKGTGGFGVTGTANGDAYDWSASIPDWVTQLGQLGSGSAGNLFQQYLAQSQVDPYAAADEFYTRGKALLDPEIEAQRVKLGGSLFGSGRLGLKIAGEGAGYGAGSGAVNPDIAGFGAGVNKAYQGLYANALQSGQDLQTNYINQLSSAADKMLKLGMTPAEIEQALIEFGRNTEAARSNAIKSQVQGIEYKNTPQQVLAGQLGNTVGQAVTDNWGNITNYVGGLFGGGSSGGSAANWFTGNGMYGTGGLFSSPQQQSGPF